MPQRILRRFGIVLHWISECDPAALLLSFLCGFRNIVGRLPTFKPTGPFIPLTPSKQNGGKIVYAWAFKGDCDLTIKCNTCTIEWPPRSGQQMEIPEIDRVEFYDLDTARIKIKAGQEGLVEEFEAINLL